MCPSCYSTYIRKLTYDTSPARIFMGVRTVTQGVTIRRRVVIGVRVGVSALTHVFGKFVELPYRIYILSQRLNHTTRWPLDIARLQETVYPRKTVLTMARNFNYFRNKLSFWVLDIWTSIPPHRSLGLTFFPHHNKPAITQLATRTACLRLNLPSKQRNTSRQPNRKYRRADAVESSNYQARPGHSHR